MPASIEPTAAADGILAVRVSGQLTSRQWHGAQEAALAAMSAMRQPPEKVPVLVIAEEFLGWERGDWPDSPFQSEFDRRVSRLAIVGEAQWEDLALLFAGKGLRRIPIAYFLPSGMGVARRWLDLPNPVPG